MINRSTILDSAGSSSVPETPVLFLRQRASCRDGFPRGESSFRVDCTVNCVSDESAINLRVRHRFPWAAPPRFPCFSMYGRDVFRGDAFVFSQSCSFPRAEEAYRPRVPFRFLFRVRQMSRKLSRFFSSSSGKRSTNLAESSALLIKVILSRILNVISYFLRCLSRPWLLTGFYYIY